MDYTFNWGLVLRYLPLFIEGLLTAIGIAAVSLVMGSVLGLAAALTAIHGPRGSGGLVRTFVEVVRNVPILLWVYAIFYGWPLIGIRAFDNVASFVVALTLYAGAYLTEVFRSGLTAVPSRYGEAARSLGLTRFQRFRLVMAPLTLRIILPPYGSTLVALFKDTSIAGAIGVRELTFAAQYANQQTFRVIEVWTIVSLLYLGVGYFLILAFRWLEGRVRMAG